MGLNSNHNFLMYFHTTLRNIGVYTTLSFAALAYPRVYRGKSSYYDILLISISQAFLVIAALVNYFLYQDFIAYIDKEPDIAKWEILLQIMVGVHLVLLTLGIITTIRSITSI